MINCYEIKMDLKNSQNKSNEIEQFLRDVRAHFKASLTTSEYENSSNLFHLTEAETTAKLLKRCELLLQKCENTQNSQDKNQIKHPDYENNPEIFITGVIEQMNGIDGSYTDMTQNYSKKKSASHEYISTGSERTYRSSTSLAEIDGKVFAYAHEKFQSDEDMDIYDTCLVSQYSMDVLETVTSFDDCPFMNLPAGHLALHKSTKFGQLQRVEKRLFFDQFKKCYCGILNNWFLCYTDQAALSPNYFLFLKVPAIQIEHYGEGKRRDICFQLTTGDPSNEKMIFQANSEVDAKEWIHAIEAVRSDLKKNRRLPTPPIMKKITFVSDSDGHAKLKSLTPTPRTSQDQIDRIYEEPSPFYDISMQNDKLLQPNELEESFEKIVLDEFYDTPKSPPKPVENISTACTQPIEDESEMKLIRNETNGKSNENPASEVAELLNTSSAISNKCASSPTNSNKIRQSLVELADKIDFQNKVKDLHSKLSSQLLSPASVQDHLQKKCLRKTYSDSQSYESETMSLTTSDKAGDLSRAQKSSSNTSTIAAAAAALNTKTECNEKQSDNCSEKPQRNWFLTRFQKTTSSARCSANSTTPTFAKCRQSEKENLLSDLVDSGEQIETSSLNGNKSKVHMIINRLEACGGHKAMFGMDAIGSVNHHASDNSDCNTYEPMMTVSTTPNRFLKKI